MWNAEYANNETAMRSSRGTHVVKHFVNVFKPEHISVKTLICHVNYRNSELTLSPRINVRNVSVLGYYRPARLRKKKTRKGISIVDKWVTLRGLHARAMYVVSNSNTRNVGLFFARSPM